VGVTGLAYGARIMPVRVLDRLGEGDSVAISEGIRFAARNGAQIINLSFEFGPRVTRSDIPDILAALRYARRKGVLVVGASGNAAARSVAYPARASEVLSVGATTQHLCVADYSNNGANLDLVAPGGGEDAAIPGDPDCRPAEAPGGNIFQMTFDGSSRRFGLPGEYMGTSMAAPHVSAAAALVIASGVIGANPSPAAIEARLKATARDLGPAGPDSRYGAGLLDAARAVSP
jgi:serine protease